MAGDGPEHDGRILDGAREGPDLVQRGGKAMSP